MWLEKGGEADQGGGGEGVFVIEFSFGRDRDGAGSSSDGVGWASCASSFPVQEVNARNMPAATRTARPGPLNFILK